MEKITSRFSGWSIGRSIIPTLQICSGVLLPSDLSGWLFQPSTKASRSAFSLGRNVRWTAKRSSVDDRIGVSTCTCELQNHTIQLNTAIELSGLVCLLSCIYYFVSEYLGQNQILNCLLYKHLIHSMFCIFEAFEP